MTSTPSELSRFRLVSVPGRPGRDFAWASLYDNAYEFWKAFWSEVYGQAGSPQSFVKEDFMRQDEIRCLLRDDEIVGMQTHTAFDLERPATRDHRYFAFYTPEFYAALAARGVRHVSSTEFLAVAPKWRRASAEVPALFEILIGCSAKDFLARGMDAGIGCGRRDVKVSEATTRWGFQKIQEHVVRRNFECDLVACFPETIRRHPDFEINRWTEELWNRRLDASVPAVAARRAA